MCVRAAPGARVRVRVCAAPPPPAGQGQCQGQGARAAALLTILQARSPHVVTLQEVTPRLLAILKASPFIRMTYLLSDSTAATLAPYGVLLLVARRAVRVNSA